MKYNFDCHWFSGYKPCKFKRSCENCPEFKPVQQRICVVSLEAMGAVLRSTCLLPAIKRKYPHSHITWITYKNAKPLLDHNPLIDRLMTLTHESIPLLNHLEFDVLFAVDKSMEAGGLVEILKAKEKYGFGLTKGGAIRPLNHEAEYQFQVGLDDELKFRINQKAETQQITESMALEWKRDPYILELTSDEKIESARRRQLISPKNTKIIGYNTGCSLLYPNKKLSIQRSIELIHAWRKEFPNNPIALLGGPEDEERQSQMKASFSNDSMVINTPTREGLRSGMVWMDTADMVLSGCSLGMHIAIGLKKSVIAWFGVSCIQEVDLYEKGVKIQSDIGCSPCWKKSCDVDVKCYDKVEVQKIVASTKQLIS